MYLLGLVCERTFFTQINRLEVIKRFVDFYRSHFRSVEVRMRVPLRKASFDAKKLLSQTIISRIIIIMNNKNKNKNNKYNVIIVIFSVTGRASRASMYRKLRHRLYRASSVCYRITSSFSAALPNHQVECADYVLVVTMSGNRSHYVPLAFNRYCVIRAFIQFKYEIRCFPK